MTTNDPTAPHLSTWTRDGARYWQAFRGSLPICPEGDRDRALRYHRGMVAPHLPFDAPLAAYAPAKVWDGDRCAFVAYRDLVGEEVSR